MPSGSATRSQSLLSFGRLGQNNTTVETDSLTLQPSKRPRTEELEVPSVHVAMDNNNNHDLPFNSGSNITVICPTRDNENEERSKCVPLDRMRNKEERYTSHIAFLEDCIKIKRIPKGLVIDLEPSIGNNDEEFCARWYQRLEDFSTTLMKDIVEYSKRIEKETSEKIASEQETLKRMMKPEDYKEVSQVLDQNSSERKQALQATKRKKFNYLKYHRESPMQQKPGSGRNFPLKRTEATDRKHTERSQTLWRNNEDTTRDAGSRAHTRHHTTNTESAEDQWSRPRSYRDALLGDTNLNRKENGHDSLRRNNSRTNISRRNSRSNFHVRRQDDRWNHQEDAKEKEIRELQSRISTLETGQKKHGEHSKNVATPRHGGNTTETQGTTPPNAEQVLTFITSTMNTLEEFKKHFTTQQHTNMTR